MNGAFRSALKLGIQKSRCYTPPSPKTVIYDFYEPEIVQELDMYDVVLASGEKITGIIVSLRGEEYDKAVESSNNMWSSEKKGEYGEGEANDDPNDDHRVERTGRMGEMVLAKMTGLKIDVAYIKMGDKEGDLWGCPIKIDAKTSTHFPYYCDDRGESMLVYRCHEWGKVLPIDKDIYVSQYVLCEDRKNKLVKIVAVGWATGKMVRLSNTYPARKGKHWNKEIPYSSLYDMKWLVDVLRERRFQELLDWLKDNG